LCPFSAFDGCKDTPVEILHVFLLGTVKYLVHDFMSSNKDKNIQIQAYWAAFNTDSLNIPYIKPAYMVRYYGSMIGKDFKVILQAAPFVFFPLMNEEERRLWFSLCYLGSIIFQTKISDLDAYISELKKHIDIFMFNISKMSAKWSNKPKYHMLTHLPESVKRFGPPSLFASEKFESYNSVLREASVHSNQHSPGRDIANTFSNYQIMRLILSGGQIYNKKDKVFFKPSDKVAQVFQNHIQIQHLMGMNEGFPRKYPVLRVKKVPDDDIAPLPSYLKTYYPLKKFRQIFSINTSEYEVVKKGTFVQVRKTYNNGFNTFSTYFL